MPWRRPIASLNYLLSLARLAPGPQRLHPPGPGLPRRRAQQEARDRAGLPAAGREHAAVDLRPLPARRGTTSTSSSRASSRSSTGCRSRTPRCTAPAASGSGSGRAPTTTSARCPTSCSPAPATSRRSRRWRPRRSCASELPDLRGPGGQRRRPDAAAARDRAPARAARPRVRHAVHRRRAGDLRLPRLPVAGPPADLPAAPTTASSTSAATRRTARRRRRSTW